MVNPIKLAFGAAALLASTAYCKLPTEHFDHFLPGWNEDIQEVLRENCSDVYAVYKTGERPAGAPKSAIISPVITCILEVFTESKKAEMASSAVLLGLLPTILQGIGSSPLEMAQLGLRRPVLAFLLAAGNPSVGGLKTFEVMENIKKFVMDQDDRVLVFAGLAWADIPRRLRPVVGVGEYVLAGAAVVNVMHLAYQLGVHAITMFTPETTFAVPLWTCLGAAAHLLATLILWLSVNVRKRKGEEDYADDGVFGSRTFNRFIGNEFTPAAYLPKREIYMKPDIKILPHFLSWVLSFGALIIMILGTLIFSSLLFFSVTDSLILVLRYIASAMACRVVTRIELNGMNDCFWRYSDRQRGDGGGEKAADQGSLLASKNQYSQVVQTVD